VERDDRPRPVGERTARDREALQVNIPLEIPDQDIVVCVRIPGEPQSWERTGRDSRSGRVRTFNTKANAKARDYVRWEIKVRHPQFPEHMDCVNRFGVAAIFDTKMWDTDADNYTKQLLDSLQQFVFKNDRQVDRLFVHVERDAEKPNQQVIVYRTKCSLGGKQI
jgi:Holliday junction resolvase RusA-like endonuclease